MGGGGRIHADVDMVDSNCGVNSAVAASLEQQRFLGTMDDISGGVIGCVLLRVRSTWW